MIKGKIFLILLPLLILFSSMHPVFAEGKRQFVIIVDNSASMFNKGESDEQKYSIQATKIINDLLSQSDDLSLLHLTSQGGCNSNIPSIVVNGKEGKAKIDSHIESKVEGDYFSSAISTASKLLLKNKMDRQLLLFITDVDEVKVSNGCNGKNLINLKKRGITLTGINIKGGNLKGSKKLFSEVEQVNNSQQLITAVAKIYQKFIGGKDSESGTVSGNQVRITINPYVKDAYLVIVADGKVGKMTSSNNNPKSSGVDLNYKGGGATVGHDEIKREYKIIHLKGPSAGSWLFGLPTVSNNAGYMLIQEYSVGIRFPNLSQKDGKIPVLIIAEGMPAKIQAKLFDEISKKDISIEKNMKLVLEDLQGNVIKAFTHNGQTFLTSLPSQKIGTLEYVTHLTGKYIDKKEFVKIKVEKGTWEIKPQVPATTMIGKSTTISIQLNAIKGNSKVLKRPREIIVRLDSGQTLILKSIQNTLKYQTIWTPKKNGTVSMSFSAKGGNKAIAATATIKVIGDARFGPPIPINFGKLKSGMTADSVLDLSNAKVTGKLPVHIETVYNKKNSTFSINEKQWITITSKNQLILENGKANKWDVRLTVSKCPEEVLPSDKIVVRVWFTKNNGQVVETLIPVLLEIEKEAWWICWWLYIVGAILTILLIWIIYCIRAPARFPSSFELLLAPESDLREEGILYKILTYKGTKSGFCRDARIFMHADIRFTKSSKGAFVKFQARNDGVYIIALGNGTLWAQRFGLEWEEVPLDEEIVLSSGTIYRNDSESLYFQARNV